MSAKKETAVSWLLFELSKVGYLPNGIPSDIHIKAKQLEKEQIETAYETALSIGMWYRGEQYIIDESEKYYSQTFGTNSDGDK
jgi:hypothetical protein